MWRIITQRHPMAVSLSLEWLHRLSSSSIMKLGISIGIQATAATSMAKAWKWQSLASSLAGSASTRMTTIAPSCGTTAALAATAVSVVAAPYGCAAMESACGRMKSATPSALPTRTSGTPQAVAASAMVPTKNTATAMTSWVEQTLQATTMLREKARSVGYPAPSFNLFPKAASIEFTPSTLARLMPPSATP